MGAMPEAREYGYTGDVGWRDTAGWHRWKVAMCRWMIAFEESEIEKHERRIRELEGDMQLFAW